jgi:GDP/UDP-N,N'-diacetylbacillosamine 2-epimerase (hydrolysing)
MIKKIVILTSSRADFGIYIPLIKALKLESSISIHIIAFGTHVSHDYGYTLREIESYHFTNDIYTIATPLENKTPKDIAHNIGETIKLFSDFWNQNSFDFIFCLGDRYEMFAAITAASPFGYKIGHIHAGEETLGAIDNMYRHAISLMSTHLFVSTEEYAKRAKNINSQAKVYCVGALSNDNLKDIPFYSIEEMKEVFNLDLNKKTILFTFHPETVSYNMNENYINTILDVFNEILDSYQIVVTLPNSDTQGDIIRNAILNFKEKNVSLYVIESFGMRGYLSCMKYASFLMGNTSSGFVEAAFFPKWVINLGDRQRGRIITDNIRNCEIEKKSILNEIKYIESQSIPMNSNIYGHGDTAKRIINEMKNEKLL